MKQITEVVQKFGRISNAIFNLVKLEKQGKIKRIQGKLYDGKDGYCLSGGLGYLFGVNPPPSTIAFGGIGEKKIFGEDYTKKFRCPIAKMEADELCDYGRSMPFQDLLIHLNDYHECTWKESGKIIQDLGY